MTGKILILVGAFRAVDVNDVLFNELEMMIGYGLFLAFGWLFTVITRHFRLSYIGLLAFIQDAGQGWLELASL